MGRCKSVLSVIAAISFMGPFIASAFAGASTSEPPATGASAPLFQLSLSASPAWLNRAPSPDPEEGTTTHSPSPATLHMGTWDLEFSGAHMGPFKSKRDYIDSGSTAIGYFIADSFSVNAALVGYSINQPDSTAFAGGFDLYARFYFLTLDRFTFYFDAGAGVFIADKEVPENGTHFNFTPRAGFGTGYHLSERVYLLAGVRYWHLSNSGIDGRNPSFDSLQYYGSIMFTF